MKSTLVLGYFCQLNSNFGFSIDIDLGLLPVLEETLLWTFFSGGFEKESQIGQLQDAYGNSEILIKEFTDTDLKFIKVYEKNLNTHIKYDLFRTDHINSLWFGTWSTTRGIEDRSGLVWIILVDLENFNESNHIAIVDFLKTKGMADQDIPIWNKIKQSSEQISTTKNPSTEEE